MTEKFVLYGTKDLKILAIPGPEDMECITGSIKTWDWPKKL